MIIPSPINDKHFLTNTVLQVSHATVCSGTGRLTIEISNFCYGYADLRVGGVVKVVLADVFFVQKEVWPHKPEVIMHDAFTVNSTE